MTRTQNDFIDDLVNYLDDFLFKKFLGALVESVVIFYVKCLLQVAEEHRGLHAYFGDISLAMKRMNDDVIIMRRFLDGLSNRMPYTVADAFKLITTIQELMKIAGGLSDSNAHDFIVVLHKHLKNGNITKLVVGDLWHIVCPTEEKYAFKMVNTLEDSLQKITHGLGTQENRINVPGLQLGDVLVPMYVHSKRHRPLSPWAVKRMNAELKQMHLSATGCKRDTDQRDQPWSRFRERKTQIVKRMNAELSKQMNILSAIDCKRDADRRDQPRSRFREGKTKR